MGVITFDNESAYIESNPTSIITKESGNTLIDIIMPTTDCFTFRGTKEEGVEYKLGDIVLNKYGDVEVFNGSRFNLMIDDKYYEDKPGKLEELKCTNCSSPLKMIPGSSICTCDYCGSTYRFK